MKSLAKCLWLALLCLLVCAAFALGSPSAEAQSKRARRPAGQPAAVETAAPTGGAAAGDAGDGGGSKKRGGRRNFDFTALGIEGKVLTPQLLYLLGRIQVELERATLETRSFMPELSRSVDEGGL